MSRCKLLTDEMQPVTLHLQGKLLSVQLHSETESYNIRKTCKAIIHKLSLPFVLSQFLSMFSIVLSSPLPDEVSSEEIAFFLVLVAFLFLLKFPKK